MARDRARLRFLPWSRAVAVALTGLAVLPASALACSVCIGWNDGQAVNVGFYWSALLLTLLPFAVVGVVGAWLGYTARRTRVRKREHDP